MISVLKKLVNAAGISGREGYTNSDDYNTYN